MGWTKGPDGKWRDPTGKAPEFEILAQAGATDWILAAEAIATQLNKQGFQVRTRAVEPGVYPTTLRGGQFDMAIQFGSAWWGTAHPLTGYYRLYQGEAAEFTGAKDVMATMKGPQGEDVNIAQALDSLLKEPNPERQKAIVRQLAWITNENLPVLSLLEKQLMIFHVDGVRVTGWPAANDPLWTVAPGAIERFYAHLLIQGILKPAP
jgi:peptide/nickel transport system substrate-binding protein